MSCTLNSGSKLSLMLSTSTGNTSGKDLGSLGETLSDPEGILIIDMLYLVSAESTNLLPLLRTERLLNLGSYLFVVIQSNNLLFQ